MSAYWIQGSDYSNRAEGDIKTARQMIELLETHDWAAEQLHLDAAGEDACPAGLGIVKEAGVILHLCPNPDGTIMTHCTVTETHKLFGLFNTTKDITLTVEKLDRNIAIAAIPKFLAADENWLKANIK